MIYKFDAYVELPNDDDALYVLDALHLALCGGDVQVDEDGTITHECLRSWEVRVAESRPLAPTAPEEEKEAGTPLIPQEVADALYPDLNDHPAADQIREALDA